MSLVQIDGLLSWGRKHAAYLHERVEVYNDQKYGIALRVRSPQKSEGSPICAGPSTPGRAHLPPMSRIVSCPFKLSLSFLNSLDMFPALEAHSPQFPVLLFEILDPHVIGNFFLVQQYLNVETSHWGPYIRSLPQPEEHQKLGTPLYFTKLDMAWIRGTSLEVARDQRESMWKTDWEKGREILDSASGWERWAGKWTWDLYRWAATIFSSRSFISTLIPKELFEKPKADGTARDLHEGTETPSDPQENFPVSGSHAQKSTSTQFQDKAPKHHVKFLRDGVFPVLFPLTDLANHSATARVTWFTNAHTEPQDLSIITESEIEEGHQIFNNYAPKSNTELLLGYGFCIPGNDEVAIAFKPVKEPYFVDSKKHVFHLRRKPYIRALNERRLPEFAVFEDGCVNVLSALVANQREKDFMARHPDHTPERGSEAAFAGPLARNAFLVMSVLHEKLHTMLDKIMSAGEHLGNPKNSCQRAAKVYRDGQIDTLRAAMGQIHARLDTVISQHTICDHVDQPRSDSSGLNNMQVDAKLFPLDSAYSWLQTTHLTIYQHAINAIAQELDVSMNPSLDWFELVTSGWDFTLWCLWIYIILLLRLSRKESDLFQTRVTNWIDLMLDIYNPAATFSSWPFRTFHGDKDEQETLATMVEQLQAVLYLDPDTPVVKTIGDIEEAKRKLMNFASAIAKEEGFVVRVEMVVDSSTMAKKRISQRVLCLVKVPDEESKALWMSPPV